MKIKAAVTHKAKAPFSYEYVDLDDPKEEEVLVKIVACGICHSDEHSRQGLSVKFPIVLGHEGAGIVEKVGSMVTSVQQGDYVVLSIPFCDECDFCAQKEYMYCDRKWELATGGAMKDGTYRITQDGHPINLFHGQSSFAEYSVCHYSNAVKIDKEYDLALASSLGCGIQTGAGTVLEYFRAEPGSTIAIFGCGCLGSAAIMGAKIAGCKTIIGVDVVDSKLYMAKELGATHTINSKKVEDIASEIMKITDGKGVKFGVDTTGNQDIVTAAINSLAIHGELCVPAVMSEVKVPHLPMMLRNLKISSCGVGNANPHTFIPLMLKYYKEGKFPFNKIISFYRFEEIEKAIEDMTNGTAVKPVLRIG